MTGCSGITLFGNVARVYDVDTDFFWTHQYSVSAIHWNITVAKIALYWGFPGSSTGEESACSAEDSGSISGSGRSPGEGKGYPFQYSWASLVAQMVKKFTCNAEDLRSIPGLGKFPGERDGIPLQYSCLENPHGQRSLAGYSPWGSKESATTKHIRYNDI